MGKLMSVDEVLIHIACGNGYKYLGGMHLISHTKYKQLEEAIDHYLQTGEIVESEYGTLVRGKDNG